MNVVGLDQSYTGFGFSNRGVAKKKAFPASKFLGPYDRLMDVEGWLRSWLVSLGPIDLVVMEGYANAAKFGREMAGELGWAVKRTAYELGHVPVIVPPTSLKKFVTGKGNAKKQEMLLGVYKRWGESFSDDNQADAYALEKFGFAWLDLEWAKGHGTVPSGDWTQFQIEAIEKVRSGK